MNLETDRDIQKFFKNTSISNVIALKRMKYGVKEWKWLRGLLRDGL